MKELKVERVAMDRDVTIPGDGSITYTVFKKNGEHSWESCGEFIDDRKDALLYAASPELLEALELAVATIERLTVGKPAKIASVQGTLQVAGAAARKAKGE